MNVCILRATIRPIAALALLALSACATLPTPAERATATQMADPVPNYVGTNLSRAEVEQMLAPVALYPNEILAQILMASTAPDDVTAAARWSRTHPELDGDDAYRAAAGEKWEAAVTALVAFPGVLQMMDEQIDWTRRLGEIVLAQSDSVGLAIMDLRRRAMQSSALDNAPVNLLVFDDSDDIAIGSGFDHYYYIPTCNPSLAYGSWPWADYPTADSIDWIIPYYVPCQWHPQGFVHRRVFGRYAAWHKHHDHKYPCPPRGSRTWKPADTAKNEFASRKSLPDSSPSRNVIPSRSSALADLVLSNGWETRQATPMHYAGSGMSSAPRIGSVFHVSGGGFGAHAVSTGGHFASAGGGASSASHASSSSSSSSSASVAVSSGGSSAGSSGSARSH